MPKDKVKLENTQASDHTGEQAPDLRDEDDLDAAKQQVQASDLRDTDRSKLVEDPAKVPASKSDSGRSKEDTTLPAKPAAPAPKPPEQSKSDSGQDTTLSPKPATPAPKPPDEYALLKKDVSTLTKDEKEERARLLAKKYITDWKKKKEEQTKDLTEGLGDNEKTKEETRKAVNVPEQSKAGKFFEEVDKYQGIGDIASDVLGGFSATGCDIADAAYSQQSAEKNNDNPGSTAGSYVNLATGGWGMLSNTYGLFRSGYKANEKSKKGDSRGAHLARFDAAGSVFGAASGATNFAGGIKGLQGDNTASGSLSIASNALDSIGSFTKALKGAYQASTYEDLANRKGTSLSKNKMARKENESRKKYKQLKAAYNGEEEGADSKEKRMEMLKARHDMKRSKDFREAMASAQANAKIKAEAGDRSAFSAGIGIGGGLINTFASALKMAGPGGKIAGAILGGIGNLIKMGTDYLNKDNEKKEQAARKKTNDESGKKYLEEKAAALMKKADAQADHITEEEAKLIVAKRLGVDDPGQYAEIFKKLSERRADRILNKEEGYEEVLAAMGLTADADKATILEALGVS